MSALTLAALLGSVFAIHVPTVAPPWHCARTALVSRGAGRDAVMLAKKKKGKVAKAADAALAALEAMEAAATLPEYGMVPVAPEPIKKKLKNKKAVEVDTLLDGLEPPDGMMPAAPHADQEEAQEEGSWCCR